MPSLRPEILAPTSAHLAPHIAIGLGAALIGASLVAATRPAVIATPAPAPLAIAAEPVTVPIAIPVAIEAPQAPEPAPDVHLVFRAGGETFVKLVDVHGSDGEVMPRHGKLRRATADYVESAIAPVALDAVPRAYRTWHERTVRVDGACTAKVTGFAIVAQLTGDPGYAGESADNWTARMVLEHGMPVLAARIDGCRDGLLAVDAAHRDPVALETGRDAALEAAARQRLLASADATTAQAEWGDLMQGTWHDSDLVTWTTQTLRHPTTGAQFVSVHASLQEGCGGPNINLWHLYAVGADGALTRVETSLEALSTIDHFVDLDGDGAIEVIGRTWTHDETRVIRANGEPVDAIARPFYGCPC